MFQPRSRTAPDRLVLFRKTLAVFRWIRGRVSVRWHELDRQRIRRLRNNYWRVTVFNPYRVADVVVHGDRRFIARLRSEIKRRRQKANRFRRLPPSPEPAFPDAPGVPMRGIAKKFPKKGELCLTYGRVMRYSMKYIGAALTGHRCRHVGFRLSTIASLHIERRSEGLRHPLGLQGLDAFSYAIVCPSRTAEAGHCRWLAPSTWLAILCFEPKRKGEAYE